MNCRADAMFWHPRCSSKGLIEGAQKHHRGSAHFEVNPYGVWTTLRELLWEGDQQLSTLLLKGAQIKNVLTPLSPFDESLCDKETKMPTLPPPRSHRPRSRADSDAIHNARRLLSKSLLAGDRTTTRYRARAPAPGLRA